MHDVGKIGIPDNIMLKPGKLDETEWVVMRMHPAMGAEIIGIHPGTLLQTAHSVALAHHEKWDGSGYPKKLKGEEIPLLARIVAIADVFDALTSMRSYKDTWTIEQAMAEIDAQTGHAFDPLLAPQFIELRPELEQVRAAYPDTASKH